MQNAAFRKVFLSCFLLVFAVLLISGAPRLIARSCEELCAEISLPPRQAYLCMYPETQLHRIQSDCEEHSRFAQNDEVALFRASSGMPVTCVSDMDANGNILLDASYMRSVYQVFALGDGFV